MILQGVFFLTFLATGLIAVRLWRLRAVHGFPGGGWWAGGSAGISAAALLVAFSPFFGPWAHSMGAHVGTIGGFCALWIGSLRFFGGRSGRYTRPLFLVFLAALAGVFSWFSWGAPDYAMRLALNCIFLAVFSLGLATTLFAARTGSGLVTTAGVLYMIFALVNTLRTVNIILYPEPGSFFLSNTASRNLTVAMLPVILAALVCLEFLARESLVLPPKNDQ